MDLKIAVRSLLKRPGFTLLAILILALGIGANTAIFSVLHQVVLRPLPYSQPDRLVTVTRTWKQYRYGQQSGPDFVDYRDTNRSFAALAAYSNGVENVITNKSGAFTGVSAVTSDFFPVFSVKLVAGRFPEADATQAVVTEGFWRRRFGDRPWKPGSQLTTENSAFEITGVVPSAFHFPEDSQTEVWIPFTEKLATTNRTAHNYIAVGRLKANVTLTAAQEEMSAIAARIARTYSKPGNGALLTPLGAYTTRNLRPVLYILFGAALLVLLIACTNVAGLLLARGTARVREFSIRAALGASFGQLTRQLLLESLLLALAGCMAGILIAVLILPALSSLAPQNITSIDNIRMEWPVLAFALGLSLLATLLCGLAPGVQAAKVDPTEGLRAAGSRGAISGSTRARRLLVAAEIGLSVVLLSSSALLLKSFSALLNVNLGYNPSNILAAEISTGGGRAQANTNLYRPLLDKLHSNPVNGAATVTRSAVGNGNGVSNGSYIVDGQTTKEFTMSAPQAGFQVIAPDYFRTLEIPFRTGRDFSVRDLPNVENVAIVNESLVGRSFPGGNAIGKRILCGFDEVSSKWMRIVGIVRDARLYGPGEQTAPAIFMPMAQHSMSSAFVLLRPKDRALTHAASLQSAIRALDPAASVRLKLIEDNLSESVAVPRFISTLTGVFAALAVVLATAGIYGLMSFSVSQRTAEIGVRLALGATRRNVGRLIVASTLRLTAIGIVFGLAGSFASTRLLQSQLFDTSSFDLFSYAAALGCIVAVAIIASVLPARRAALVEPMAALRQE